jgi:hypothetical protein
MRPAPVNPHEGSGRNFPEKAADDVPVFYFTE